ncbi:4-coumarate--CoA ligase 1-like [Drosophila innubila]|uniref:4-coumarate--CoA ligase 1-like n=1 Tax=Drosophila innubila TaxID=198719 RepID=UPI00148C322E|nr:4-coumarate--CoA ligase 1-like [Drosophila innubila]
MLFETTYNEQEKLWQGAQVDLIFEPHITIGDFVFKAFKDNPANNCQIWHEKDQVVTNEEALKFSIRLAQYFRDEGLTHKDVVGVLTRNNIHEAHVLFACFFNATPFHAVNPNLEPDAIAALYAITKPKLIFCDGNDYEFIKSITVEWNPKICTLINHIANVPRIEDHLEPTSTENVYTPKRLVLGADQTMGIICTSGTTGIPKAVTLSNAQLVLLATSGGTNDVIFTGTSFDWISAIKTALIGVVSGAPRIVSTKPFSVERYVEIVRKHKVTTCHLSHWQFQEVFSSPLATPENLSSLQIIAYGGGWVSASVVQRAQRILENAVFVFLYGTTETDMISTAINPTEDNLVGFLMPTRSVRILNEQGDFLGPNEIGEIVIKTNQNWNGYYGNAEQSANTRDSNGWFHMGDLGYFDSDNNLYVVDRKKNLLKYKSIHYTPNDIEKIIMEMLEVYAVCVVGIRDKFFNEIAGALIIKKSNSLLSEQQVIQYVAKRIPVEYKQLHAGVRFVDSLPLNHNGKILRNVAKEMFQQLRIPKASL